MKVHTISVLKIAATLLLLGLLFMRVDLALVFGTFTRFGAQTWVTNLALFLASAALAALKWKTLIPQHSFPVLLRLTFIAQYYSTLLPGQVAGEVVKAFRLGRGRRDAEQIAASVIIDRITGFLGLVIVAIGGAILARNSIDNRILWALLGLLVPLLAGLFCLKLPAWLRLMRAVAARLGRFAPTAGRIIDAWRSYLDAPGVLLLSTMIGAAYQLTSVWINVRFARELGINVGFPEWCLIFGLISVVTALPFTVAGLGLREGSFIGALALFAVPAEKALAVSLAVFGLLLAGALIGGVLEWCRRPVPVPANAPVP